jgi:hypothetical protein
MRKFVKVHESTDVDEVNKMIHEKNCTLKEILQGSNGRALYVLLEYGEEISHQEIWREKTPNIE